MTTEEQKDDLARDLDPDAASLGKAFRAVRERYDGTHLEPDATLRRALLASRKDVRRRRMTRWVILPLAATLAASTAWAGVTGRLAPSLHSISEVFRGEHAPPPKTAMSSTPPSTATPSTSAAPAPPPSTLATNDPPLEEPPRATAETPPAPAAPSVPAREEAPAIARPSAAPIARVEGSSTRAETRAEPTPRATASAADPNAALFEEAHRLHFQAHDPARALVAWDRYLAAAPNGRFAPEARYNRALTLVRLGRHDEAKSALESFANGTYGEYRRAEARALLEALARDH
jgi:hypothetical protein